MRLNNRPIDDVVVIPGPNFQTIRMSRWNMSDYMHLLAVDLSTLQFVHEPLQLANRIGAIYKKPPVLVVAIVHIDGEYSETRPD